MNAPASPPVTVPLDPDALRPGTVVGGFRVEGPLGRGAFGTVYVATRGADGARAALKVMSGRALSPAGGVERFQREADLARRLAHPNIVRVLDAGMEGPLVYTAFELLSGATFEDELRRGPVPPRRVGALAIDVLRGLEEAHRLGVIHRDIKPGNLFIERASSAGERAKILDFGVAKSINPNTVAGLTRDGISLGTPAYMAPEQLAGLPAQPAADLFAFGLVLAELLMGRDVYPPSVGALDILKERLSGARPPIPPEVVASPFGALIERATTPDPAHRTASAADMRAMVEAAVGALPADPAPPPSPRRSRAPLLAGVGVLAIGGAVVAAILLASGPTAPSRAAPSASASARAAATPPAAPAPIPASSSAPASASVALSPATDRFEPMPYAVGQWIRMNTTRAGRTSVVEYRIVGRRDDAWVLELDVDGGASLTEVTFVLADRRRVDGMRIVRARARAGGATPMELPVAATGPLLAELQRTLAVPDFDPKDRVDVTTAAGKFDRCFARPVDESVLGHRVVQRSASHPSVPINALVRSDGTVDGEPSTTELVAFGTTGAAPKL